MMKIDKIWSELENDSSLTHGLLMRRYSVSVLPDVFVAMSMPGKFRSIAVSVSNDISLNTGDYSDLKDISIELIPDEKRNERSVLVLKLLNNQHKDIFSVLGEDLIINIPEITEENELVAGLLNRLEKWKSLFDKLKEKGLSSQEQRGLYGELFFLRKFFQYEPDLNTALNSWTGPEMQIRDFQVGNWGVEVKTTFGNNHQKIHINSERQLDTSNIRNLFLYHISLEQNQEAGETLNQIVDSVYNLISDNYTLLNRFKNKLLEAGYFDNHRSVYENIGYSVRQNTLYKVTGNFPRIEESDIREGVGDVKYSIITAGYSDYTVPEEDVFNSRLSDE